jgi:monoamine oxidase
MVVASTSTSTTTTMNDENNIENDGTADDDNVDVSIGQNIYDVIVVGGGLSGCTVANGLHEMSSSLSSSSSSSSTEAQSVLGGRLSNAISSSTSRSSSLTGNHDKRPNQNEYEIDMGGTWIWPTYQPNIQTYILRKYQHMIQSFPQPGDPSSIRIVGGAISFIHALVSDLTPDDVTTRMILSTAVASCTRMYANNGDPIVHVTTKNTSSAPLTTSPTPDHAHYEYQSWYARHVVFAIPPKIMMKHIVFTPPLSFGKQNAVLSPQCHTWMAGVTKVALIYSRRFWTDVDMTQLQFINRSRCNIHGPAFQVYDSCTKNQSTCAFTCFCHIPSNRQSNLYTDDGALAHAVATQLQQVWHHLCNSYCAAESATYIDYCIQRWPMMEYISENQYPSDIHPHPDPIPDLATTEWDGLLHFAGTETDQNDPGVMEGAVSSATRVLQSLRTLMEHTLIAATHVGQYYMENGDKKSRG